MYNLKKKVKLTMQKQQMGQKLRVYQSIKLFAQCTFYSHMTQQCTDPLHVHYCILMYICNEDSRGMSAEHYVPPRAR